MRVGFPLAWACLLAARLLLPPAVRAGEALSPAFLRDYAETRGFRLGRPTGFQVVPDGSAVLFLRASARSARQGLYEFEVSTGRLREWVPPGGLSGGGTEGLSDAEKARRERMRVSVAGVTSFELSKDGRQILVPLGGRLLWVDRSSGAIRELPLRGEAFDPKLSPEGRSVGFVRDHDVWALDLKRGREWRVTKGGSAVMPHGEAEFVAAEEMSRFTGWWWSPDGTQVAFQETDTRGVEVWQVADPAHPESAPRPQPYPRPGHANVGVRLGIIPARGGRVRWVEWDSRRHPYLARVDWHRAGGLTLVVQSRDQKEVVVLSAEPRTGRVTPLLTERDPVWVNLDPQMPRWLEDGSAFLWTTEREGAWQLERRAANGAFQGVLVPPSAGYRSLLTVDAAGASVVYAGGADPTCQQLFRTASEGGPAGSLTGADGVHGGVFGRWSGPWVHTWTTPGEMPRAEIRSWGGGEVLGEIPAVAESPGFVPTTETLRVGSGEGWYAEVTRPRGFQAGRRYPVLVEAYGGPHANVVESAMPGRLLSQWLADQGFLVVSLDNRGTPRRGREWERAIAGRFGEVPLEDQAAGLRALGERFPEMDLGRVGIVGWSFGGYLSALAVLRRPDVFHAAVAGAPVTDWLDYDTHYTERYLGVPGPGDTVYAANSLLRDAAGLARPLLLLHGTGDDNVFFRHTLKLGDALFRAGRPFDVLPLPGLTHMVPDPLVMERQWTLTAGFFCRHLGVETAHGAREVGPGPSAR